MAINDPGTAKALVGATLTVEQLDVGQSIMDNYTQYRWRTVSETRQFTGNGEMFYYIFSPVTAFNSLKEIDVENSEEITLTRFQDYDLDLRTGRIENYLGFLSPRIVGRQAHYSTLHGGNAIINHNIFTTGHNNYEVDYEYGYDSNNRYFAIARFVEAALALLIKKNPLMLANINLTGGDKIGFDNTDPVFQIVKQLPRSVSVVGV